jgi:hypothetical protein
LASSLPHPSDSRAWSTNATYGRCIDGTDRSTYSTRQLLDLPMCFIREVWIVVGAEPGTAHVYETLNPSITYLLVRFPVDSSAK